MRLITVATCSLNQWALDFQGNYERILDSILLAKERSATFRTGPELEICGYGCNDHFYENDTFIHSWEVLCRLLEDRRLYEILIDCGMPVILDGVRYNCRILFMNGKILLIRPKLFLANDGNYREGRWFTAWSKAKQTVSFDLPLIVSRVTGQTCVPFGDAIIVANDVKIGIEICEELFTPRSPNVDLSFSGVDIIANGSGSHHELRKLKTRLDLLIHATTKNGGAYLYANQQGCDGERMYYDGCAMISMNGDLYAQGSQFSPDDVEVVVACLDLDEISSYRGSIASRSAQASTSTAHPVVRLDAYLAHLDRTDLPVALPISPSIHTVEEEIQYGPACWLWDYLRRSRMRGFFLPLSGGIDSCSTALIVSSMCRLLEQKIHERDAATVKDIERIVGFIPKSHQEICNSLFATCYMKSKNSSKETEQRALKLSKEIGSYHKVVDITDVTDAILQSFEITTGFRPKFKAFGGNQSENLALQNIQARSRMVLAYFFAQLIPLTRGSAGSLLVLGSANVDECLRGYFTKYDCSSADLNPIGSISKVDLKRFVKHCEKVFSMPLLSQFVDATPTAELEPIVNDQIQKDEEDMGFTYEELSIFGRLRKMNRCGPLSTFQKLSALWGPKKSVSEIADKVKSFFRFYSINRHKMTIITPSYHAESYSPDDNRFDLRPFLYRSDWKWQFNRIDQEIASQTNIQNKL